MENLKNKLNSDTLKIELEQVAQFLETSSEYRVLRRFHPVSKYGQYRPQQQLKIGLYVDVETTGLDSAENKIIEFGAVRFTYDNEGNIFEILEEFCAFEDPGIPITKEASEVHKIFDDDVKGKRIDDAKISELLENTSIVIAHNAKFDRKLIEERFQGFDTLPWACSCTEVPWKKTFGSIDTKLGNVLAACGQFCDENHQALADCQVGVHVLASAKVEGRSAFSCLLEGLNQDSCFVLIETPRGNNNEDMKARLKSRGYKWVKNSNGKWIGLEKVFLEHSDVTSEIECLKKIEDKSNPFVIRSLTINAHSKYSSRITDRDYWPITTRQYNHEIL